MSADGAGQGPAGLPWPELAGGEPGPLYGVFGEEDFLVGHGVEAFCQCAAFGPNAALNIERFHAADAPPARVLESARTLPFLGRRRLVLVLDADQYKAAQLGEFVGYLEDPPPSACLVFAGSKLDARTKFAKLLQQRGRVHVFAKLYPNQLPPWLQGRAKVRGKRLSVSAAAFLAELAGLGLGALDSEVEKLSLYVGKRPEIGLDDARAVVGGGRLRTIFDLTDAIAAADLHRALTAFNQLHALGEAPVRVLAMVQRMFRQVLEASRLLERGGDERQVARQMRIPPQAAQTLLGRARRESKTGLSARLARLLQADMALKSSPATDRAIVERLIMDLCRMPSADARRGKNA